MPMKRFFAAMLLTTILAVSSSAPSAWAASSSTTYSCVATRSTVAIAISGLTEEQAASFEKEAAAAGYKVKCKRD